MIVRSRIKLAPDGKGPGSEGSWTISENEEDIDQWIFDGYNIGLVAKGITVVDLDDKELAREFWKKYREIITTAWETKRGIHIPFSGEVPITKGEKRDWKSG